jgi:hypothetical protein
LFDVRVGQFFDSFRLKKNLIPDNEVRVIVVRQALAQKQNSLLASTAEIS